MENLLLMSLILEFYNMNIKKNYINFKSSKKSSKINSEISTILEMRNELQISEKQFKQINQLKKWYFKIVKNSKVKVNKIKLNQCKKWNFSENKIKHLSEQFFKVEGLRIHNPYRREVGKSGWDQPILTEPNFKGGILGLVRKKIGGFPHYLINVKFEPGNYRLYQLSPTLQATFSNIQRYHKGNHPDFLNYFLNPYQQDCEVIFKQWLSEEGGRLKFKRNLGMIVEHKGKKITKLPENYNWATLYQIKKLILENAIVNPHLRSLVSFI